MSTVCRDPESLLPRQRHIATSPFLRLQGAAKSVKAQKRKTKKSFTIKKLTFWMLEKQLLDRSYKAIRTLQIHNLFY